MYGQLKRRLTHKNRLKQAAKAASPDQQSSASADAVPPLVNMIYFDFNEEIIRLIVPQSSKKK